MKGNIYVKFDKSGFLFIYEKKEIELNYIMFKKESISLSNNTRYFLERIIPFSYEIRYKAKFSVKDS